MTHIRGIAEIVLNTHDQAASLRFFPSYTAAIASNRRTWSAFSASRATAPHPNPIAMQLPPSPLPRIAGSLRITNHAPRVITASA